MKQILYPLLYTALFLAGFYLFSYDVDLKSLEQVEQLGFRKMFVGFILVAAASSFRRLPFKEILATYTFCFTALWILPSNVPQYTGVNSEPVDHPLWFILLSGVIFFVVAGFFLFLTNRICWILRKESDLPELKGEAI